MYGYITIPLEKDSSLETDISQLTNIKLEITGNDYYNVVCGNNQGSELGVFVYLKN